MAATRDLLALDDVLNDLATMYQFRSLDDRVYGGALTVSQSYCLRLLYFRGPRTMGELAVDLDVRLSTMTGVVDQLEEKGWAERVDHPADRRSLQVKLTTKGRTLYKGAHDAFLAHLEPLFAGRSPAARADILAFLTAVTGAVQGWRSNPRKGRRHAKAHT